MSSNSASPSTGTYSVQAAACWRRIELEEPASYWEENVVEGRRSLRRQLFDWMGEVAGLAVLDAGCGFGTTARELAERGARVVGCDLRADAIAHARRQLGGDNPTFLHEDLQGTIAGSGRLGRGDRFDVLLLLEVIEELAGEDRDALLLALAECRAQRLFLSVKIAGAWSRFLEPLLPAGLGVTHDPVPLLRSLHLETPYRMLRQTAVRRRNFAAQLIELSQPGLPDVFTRDGSDRVPQSV